MSRSKWKIPIIDNVTNDKKIMQRHFQISANNINQTVQIYTGKEYKKVKITREKLGFKYGFFCFTRKFTKKILSNKNLKKKS